MTNEEKSIEIADNYIIFDFECNNSNRECYLSAMEMAEWKDERAKKAFCRTRCGKDADGCDRNCPVLQLFCDELNE